MKLKDTVIIKKEDDKSYLIDESNNVDKFNGFILLNSSSLLIVTLLKEGNYSKKDIVNILHKEYKVNKLKLYIDINKVIKILKKYNLITL